MYPTNFQKYNFCLWPILLLFIDLSDRPEPDEDPCSSPLPSPPLPHLLSSSPPHTIQNLFKIRFCRLIPFLISFKRSLTACIVFNNLQDLLLKSILLKQQMLLSLISLKLYIGMKSSCACQLGTPDLPGLK